MEDFNKCLSDLMYNTGAEQKSTSFLVNDTDIKYEAMVECINNLLNTGEVPNLFEADPATKDKIMQIVRTKSTADGYNGDQWN